MSPAFVVRVVRQQMERIVVSIDHTNEEMLRAHTHGDHGISMYHVSPFIWTQPKWTPQNALCKLTDDVLLTCQCQYFSIDVFRPHYTAAVLFSNNVKEIRGILFKLQLHRTLGSILYKWKGCNITKMVLMTMIARVVDGLPLAATMQEDEQVTIVSISSWANYDTAH